MEGSPPTKPRRLRFMLLFIILPLAVGVILSLLIPQPVIGVIYLNDAIYDYSAGYLIEQINYAREHSEIRAVVLVLSSPGGTVSDSESVYLELARLREEKPVVTAVEAMAASGAYYLAVGTDYIIAKPSSAVGNVGIIGYLPPSPGVEEEVYSTGPYKLWGSPRDTFVREIEMLKHSFLQAVKLGRGDALQVSDEVILRGQLWMGSDALRMGLVDELGAQSLAYEKAAQMARVTNYRVEDLYGLAVYSGSLSDLFFRYTAEGLVTPYPNKAGMYMLYIPPVPGEVPGEVQP